MAGWNLKEGKLNLDHYEQDEFWNIFKKVFSDRTKKTTSYKFCFLKAIMDNIFKCNSEYVLSFEVIFDTVSEIYWNLIYIHGISQLGPNIQKNESKIESIYFIS